MLLFAALLVGLLGALLIGRWLDWRVANRPRQVLVAAEDLKAGARLATKDLKWVQLPAGQLPKGAFEDVRALDGRALARDVAKETPFSDEMLAPMGTVAGLATVIAPGTRAMTVRVNDVVGVAGFALPGNYVDIIVNIPATSSFDRRGEKTISKIVLERVLVLAVAQQANRDETVPKVVNAVTLQVSPEQAEKIDVARSVGTLSLVLRNQLDQQAEPTQGATRASLLGLSPELPKQLRPSVPAPVRGHCTPVIAGTLVSSDCW